VKTSSCLFRSLAILSLGVVAIVSSARAQVTVSWGTESEGRYFADAAGSLLPEGSLVLLGSFAAATDFAGNASDYSYLSSQFTTFSSAFIGDGGFTGVDGALAAASVTSALNRQLSYWAFNAATTGAATEWGIFTQTTGLWTTPNDPFPSSMNTDLVDANVANIGSFAPSLDPLVPSLARTAILNLGPVATVPDSSVGLLNWFAIGATMVSGRMFKRRLGYTI